MYSINYLTLFYNYRCEIWAEKCGIDVNIDVSKKHVRVCEHFESRCFLNDLKNRLQPHAVPTLFTGIKKLNILSHFSFRIYCYAIPYHLRIKFQSCH